MNMDRVNTFLISLYLFSFSILHRLLQYEFIDSLDLRLMYKFLGDLINNTCLDLISDVFGV